MSTTYRQGDVLLLKVESLPADAQPEKLEEDRIVLAYGETTGHAHALSTLYSQLYAEGKNRYLVTTEGATLVHEEHAPIPLKPGVYKVIQQREYVPQLKANHDFIPMTTGAANNWRPVRD